MVSVLVTSKADNSNASAKRGWTVLLMSKKSWNVEKGRELSRLSMRAAKVQGCIPNPGRAAMIGGGKLGAAFSNGSTAQR